VAEFIRRRPHPDCPPPDPAQLPEAWDESITAEVAGVLAESRCAADAMLGLAYDLEVKLPGTAAAFRDGILRRSKVAIIARATAVLDPAEAREAEQKVLDRAGRLTPGGLRAAIARAVMEVAPEKARQRREVAEKFARVERWAEDSGNAALAGRELPPALVFAADQRITAWAGELKRAGLEGGVDELRARALLDLLLGQDSRPGQEGAAIAAAGPADGFAARVNLTVPLGTAAKPGTWRLRVPGDGPDLLVSFDPIDTAECDHRFQAQGHDPGVKLRHLTQVRHATCTAPWCRRPAAQCDFEHNTPYETGGRTGGGKTVSVWNTANGRLIRTFRPVTSSARPGQFRFTPIPLRVAITGNGDVVASGDSDGAVCLWNIATGKLIAVDTLSEYAIVELNSAASGSPFLAVDWPDVVSGVIPPGTGHVLDPSTGKVLASLKYPETPVPIINPGAALSADGGFLLAGVTGLAPAPPGGFETAYQVATGQTMASLQSAVESGSVAYSESPVRPWAPAGDEVLAGTAIYPCDACGTTATLRAAAASRIAWSQPLSVSDDHPPATDPYR